MVLVSKCPNCGKWQISKGEDKSFIRQLIGHGSSKIVSTIIGAFIGSVIPVIGTIAGGIAGYFLSNKVDDILFGEIQYKFVCTKCGQKFSDNLSSMRINQLIMHNTSEDNITAFREKLAEVFVMSKFIKLKDIKLHNRLQDLKINDEKLYKQLEFEFGLKFDKSIQESIKKNSVDVIDLFENIYKYLMEEELK